jgi:hypothetical protein
MSGTYNTFTGKPQERDNLHDPTLDENNITLDINIDMKRGYGLDPYGSQ